MKLNYKMVQKILFLVKHYGKIKINNLDFTKIWKIHTTLTVDHTHQTYYSNYCTMLLKHLQIQYRQTNLDRNCDYCNKTESNLYLFTSCRRIKNMETFPS